MPADRIDKVVIRMYRMGTGDCFTVKFMKGDNVSFKMMIDCGCWTGSKERLKPFIKELKKDVDNHVDVLVVTHEHLDHVLGFQRCKDLFVDGFQADRIWMAWTENDGDRKVEKWKKKYGDRKNSLAMAARKIEAAVASPEFKNHLAGARGEAALYARRETFAQVLRGFAELHATAEYADALAGMAVVKEEIADDNIFYFEPGELIEDLPGLEGVRIFVLGPPKLYDEVETETGSDGEAYQHNKTLEDAEAFAAALTAGSGDFSNVLPFDDAYVTTDQQACAAYDTPADVWRRIDHDWLFSAGAFALRMSTLTNNLSLVLAIEFIDSGKILLFPGDAEIGSWQSWHRVKWDSKVRDLTTEQILNRVIFYKVAHHLSHNGTARSIGLDMMTSPELSAMATLDYDVISAGWTSTMPNVMIIKDLLEKTQGRTMIMNTDNLLFDRREEIPLETKIKEYRKRMSADARKNFKKNLDETDIYISFTLDI